MDKDLYQAWNQRCEQREDICAIPKAACLCALWIFSDALILESTYFYSLSIAQWFLLHCSYGFMIRNTRLMLDCHCLTPAFDQNILRMLFFA